MDKLELRRLLNEPEDEMNALVEINSGAGGTDACDWAEMLLRMYTRWAEQNDYGVEVLDRQAAEAGIRSATLAARFRRLRLSQKRNWRSSLGAHFPF